MKKIKQATREGSEILIHFESEDEKEKPMVCRSIRGGLTFPSAESPGYLMVVGQTPIMNIKRKKPIVIFHEFETELPTNLYDEVIKCARKYLCWDYFADFNINSRELYESFEEYMTKRDMNRMSLEPPSLTDWNTSILLTQEWIGDKSLTIPFGGIVHDQLKRMTREDRKDSRKPLFHAANALRCVLGSFVEERVSVGGPIPAGSYKYD